MEQAIISNFKKVNKAGVVVFPVLLFLYPFYHVNWGIDLMDAGYGLGNFFFFHHMDTNWKLATFLSNICGTILTSLPGGSTYLGMNLYTSLLLSMIALISYFFLIKCFAHPYLIFIGEWIALSMCWAPTTILYHYLSYYLLTFAIIFIEFALKKKSARYFLFAGIILGMNIFVRMPNITHMACILVVWYDAFFLYPKKDKFRKSVRNTCVCIVGYLIGIGIPFATICFQYKFQAYIEMIEWLFGMTETATDYKPTSMVSAMFGDYISYSVWLVLMLLYLFAGITLFKLQRGKWEKAKKTVYVLGSIVMVRFFYGRGMFGLDYQSYFSVYKWMVVYLLIFWLLAIWCVCQSETVYEQLGVEKEQIDSLKRLTVGIMVIVMVTPLGSNNGLYPIMNNLFLVAPMTLFLLVLFVKRYQYFALKVLAIVFVLCICIQTTMFGTHFTFHDGEKSAVINTKITQIPVLINMKTTDDKATELENLYQYVINHKLQKREVIVYGDIPAIPYILRMKPALFTTWADLGSNTYDQLSTSVRRLEQTLQKNPKMEKPVVIVSADAGAYLTDDPEGARILEMEENKYADDKKIKLLSGYLEKQHYMNTYCNSAYMVFE